MQELYFSSTKTMPYGKLNRRKVTDFRTDEEVPAPVQAIYKGGIVKKEHNRNRS